MRAASSTKLPDRQLLLSRLGEILGDQDLPALQKVQLHYLGGRVEAEVFFGVATIPVPERLARLEQVLADRLRGDPCFRNVTIHWTVAPK